MWPTAPTQAVIAEVAVAAERPDAVFIAGDLVYGRGLAWNTRARFFLVYNGGGRAAHAPGCPSWEGAGQP